MLHFLADSAVTGDTAVNGGIAAIVIGFAGTIVKIAFGMVDKERARGDRLEAAALAAVPAMATQAQAAQQNIQTMQELTRRIEDLTRNRT